MDALNRQRRSPALLAAQQKLIELRQIHRTQSNRTGPSIKSHGRPESACCQLQDSSKRLPQHLGWGSEPLTAAIRAAEARRSRNVAKASVKKPSWLPAIPAPTEDDPQNEISQGLNHIQVSSTEETIRLYPDIAMAMLKRKLVASGRIWLLLHYIDEQGRGWIEIEEARELLARKSAALRVCGWRQLRKLLAQGEGIFWQRKNNRIWLRSVAKIALALGVQRLGGLPVALPLGILLQSIGLVRAHFYASFHSSRHGKEDDHEPRPMARERLQQLGHISRRTQRRYERKANVQCQNNYAISNLYSTKRHQEQAWKRGRAVFLFTDYRGKLGRKEATYTAWQLPNSYEGPHDRLARGRQKRINRELADLFMKGMTGNSKFSNPEKRPLQPSPKRCFFANGLRAGENYNRYPKQDAYWLSQQNRGVRCRLWHLIPGQESA